MATIIQNTDHLMELLLLITGTGKVTLQENILNNSCLVFTKHMHSMYVFLLFPRFLKTSFEPNNMRLQDGPHMTSYLQVSYSHQSSSWMLRKGGNVCKPRLANPGNVCKPSNLAAALGLLLLRGLTLDMHLKPFMS